ncbi:MAG: DUF1802 family protein [Prochloraceae cyanobacterium]|nr:DUF1802 family protein [Prochloraceae cyanobacterium]
MDNNRSISIATALRLPAPDITALIEGRSLVAISRIFINPEKTFALYPSDTSSNALPNQQYYRPNFLDTAEKAIAELNDHTVDIKAWAKCYKCEIINQEDKDSFEILSQLTVWTEDAWEKTISQRGHIFLTYLRVYPLPEILNIPVSSNSRFVSLPIPIALSQINPILSDLTFDRRSHELENRIPPKHPELEQLISGLAPLSDNNLGAKQLDRNIRNFLGWNNKQSESNIDPDLIWIERIATVGNSSDGNEFEKLVRKGLIKLGFGNYNTNPKASLDPEATGGAGGIDFYCETPYPVVGECKATQTETVPSSTPGQLIQLGNNHLGREKYDRCLKLIVAAGRLTQDAQLTAMNNQISVIRPETLQKLVEMQAKYRNSIDLFKLKECLQDAYGLADDRVEEYLRDISQEIEIRSHIVKVVKNYLENTQSKDVVLEAIHGAFVNSNPPKPLNREEIKDILIELSSPLAGYLGRKRGRNGADRFYFLRDLSIN